MIDKNIINLRDTTNAALEAKLLAEKEARSKELLLKKKNKEVETANKALKVCCGISNEASKYCFRTHRWR